MLKNITLSADETLIQQAQRRARAENVTLNDLFREWLGRYTSQAFAADRYDALMSQLGAVQSNRKFSREEMNEHV